MIFCEKNRIPGSTLSSSSPHAGRCTSLCRSNPSKGRYSHNTYLWTVNTHPNQMSSLAHKLKPRLSLATTWARHSQFNIFWVWAIENCYGTENISFFWSMAKVLHVHNDLGLFNNTTISFIFIFSPLRLFQTLATSLRGPITPVGRNAFNTWTILGHKMWNLLLGSYPFHPSSLTANASPGGQSIA